MASDPPAAHACVRCGATLDDDAPEGSICAACAGSEAEEHTPTAILGETPSQPLTGSVRTAAPAQPERIGDFEVLGKLGQGGMGAVYRARQVSLDRIVALKILPSQFEEDDQFVARFQREASVAASLNHPNLVRVYTSGVADGCHFIAMELVEGENLRQHLKRTGSMPPVEALRLCLGVARGLQIGWQKAQLIHRDIKPSNIYLSHSGEAKLGDLGLAKSLLSNTTGVTHTGTAIGTPHYISPEQARGDKVLDFRADIYSLGCTLYELLTGATPYRGSDPLSIMNMHLTSPPPAIMKVLPQCPMLLGRLVNKMLRKGKHERHASYEELIAAIEAAIEQIVNPAGPSAIVAAWKEIGAAENSFLPARGAAPAMLSLPASNGGKSKPWLWISAAAALILSVAGLYVFTRPASPTPSGGHRTLAATPLANAVKASGPAPPVPTPSTAAPWIDLLHDPALSLTNVKRTAEGLLFEENSKAGLGGGGLRDGALRLRTVVGRCDLQLKARSHSLGVYILRLGNGGEMDLGHWSNETRTSTQLGRFTPSEPLKEAAEFTLELRVVGEQITVSLNEKVIVTAHDPHIVTGNFLLVHDHGSPLPLVKSLELLDLDASAAAAPAKPAAAPTAVAGPASATKDAPFVNSLGMKFVPVPITGGPTGGQRLLFSIWETRVQDYDGFAKETKREWPTPGFEQAPTHPAVQVSWEDAQAFCAWLTARERKAGKLAADERYRLPSDHEWSCAVRLGDREDPAKPPAEKHSQIEDTFAWGRQWPPPEKAGNYASEELRPLLAGKYPYFKDVIPGYHDGYAETAPVGSFADNAFGLYDMSGNVWQWCEDWFDQKQDGRVERGGSWRDSDRRVLQPSSRFHHASASRSPSLGFRVVLGPAPEG